MMIGRTDILEARERCYLFILVFLQEEQRPDFCCQGEWREGGTILGIPGNTGLKVSCPAVLSSLIPKEEQRPGEVTVLNFI